MALKRASDYYAGAETCVSPLWRLIHSGFTAPLLATVGEEAYDDELYVRERMGIGLEDTDISEHIESDSKQLLLVVGPAGVGKTTMINHALRQHLREKCASLILVDVMGLAVDPASSDGLLQQVEESILGGLERIATQNGREHAPYWKFILSKWSDPQGIASILQRRLIDGSTVDALSNELSSVLARMSNEDRFRLRAAFIRQELGLLPAVILDNCDRLPTDFQRRLLRFAATLSRGTMTARTLPGSKDLVDHCITLMAIRPETLRLMGEDRAESIGYLKCGNVSPPLVHLVLEKRLKRFLSRWSGSIVRAREDRERLLSEVFDQFNDDLSVIEVEERLRESVQRLAANLTADENIASLVHRLTNFNLRTSLLAVVEYAASGHNSPKGLTESDDPYQPRKPSYRMIRALFLGTQSIYRSQKSWLLNMFDDRLGKQASALTRLRMLKMTHKVERASPEILVDGLHRLFDVDQVHGGRILEELFRCGLVQEVGSGGCALTDAGRTYMQVMIRDFNYLQHVIIDSPVENHYLLECRDRDEHTSTRFSRVLRFAEWVCQIEAEDLRRILNNQEFDNYEKIFGDETIAGTIAGVLDNVLPTLRRLALASHDRNSRGRSASEDVEEIFQRLSQRTSALLNTARFDSLIASVNDGTSIVS